MDDEAVDLAFIGMHQDRAAAATGEIDRVGAGVKTGGALT